MTKTRKSVPCLLALVVGSACGGAAASGLTRVEPAERGPASPFVRVDGVGFVADGAPFRFVGANVAVVHGARMREGMPETLDAVREDGLSVIRVWALGEASGTDSARWRRAYAFRVGPDEWVEESFEHLDRVLVEARARGLRVIVVLANRWKDYGGMPQIARWAGIEPRRPNLLPSELLWFLSNERARALYRAHLERVVGRTNSISGVPYRDDPTILAWELVNEISAPTCAVDRVLVPWVEEMATAVRAIDPNHLVSSGDGGYRSELGRDSWERVNALDEISYADTHVYTQFDPDVTSDADLARAIEDRALVARRRLGKPLVVGEVGFPRYLSLVAPRPHLFDAFFDAAEDAGVAGALVWIYRPWDEQDDFQGIWARGPFAEESAHVRSTIRTAAARWRGRGAIATSPRLAAADDDSRLFSTDLHRMTAWPEGTWSSAGSGAHRVSIDPWAVAEGCSDHDGAWTERAIAFPRGGVPSDLEVLSIGEPALPEPGASEPLAIEVSIARTVVGIYDGPGRFRTSGREALARAFEAHDGEGLVRWLRLTATTRAGAAALVRSMEQLPSDGSLELAVRWAAPPTPAAQ